MKIPFIRKKTEESPSGESNSAKNNSFKSLSGVIGKIFSGLPKYKISFHIEKQETAEIKEAAPIPDEIVEGVVFEPENENPDIENIELENEDVASGGQAEEPDTSVDENGETQAENTPEVTEETAGADTDAPKPASTGGGSVASSGGAKKKKEKQPKPVKEKPPKPVKEKSPKVKQPKQPAEKKTKAKPEKTNTGESGEEKKKSPMLLFIIIGGVIAIGGGLFAAFMIMGGDGPDYAKIFEDAESLRAEEDFSKAQSEYNKIINASDADADLLVDSYIGLAETFISMDIMDTAVQTLEAGYEKTGAPEVKEKLDGLLESQKEEVEPPAPVSEPIEWNDTALEKMVRVALEIDDAKPIMTEDVEKIKILKIVGGSHAVADDSINASNSVDGYTVNGEFFSERGDIKSLADIKHFKNLQKLVICYNRVDDITGISGLKNLETLGLYANNITDISGISELPNLRYLYIFSNNIQDISPLGELSELAQLYAQYNKINDISPLKGLEKLTQIYMNHNELTDISVLADIPAIRLFYADNNMITDMSVVRNIPMLTSVSFKNNPGA